MRTAAYLLTFSLPLALLVAPGCDGDDHSVGGVPGEEAPAAGSGGGPGEGGNGGTASGGGGGAGGAGSAGGGSAGGGGPSPSVGVLSLASSRSCAVVAEGKVLCWGRKFLLEQGADPGEVDPLPTPVLQAPGVPLTGARSVATGGNLVPTHGCVVTTGGEARCWGDNSHGQIGDGTTTERPYAVPVLQAPGVPLTGVQSIVVQTHRTCALLESGQARCWGGNDSGELGDGTTAERHLPVPVLASSGTPLTDVRDLSTLNGHACAVVGGGEVRCWGRSTIESSMLILYPEPIRLASGAPLTGARAVKVGLGFGCAALDNGEAHCWGSNFYGELGDGTKTNRVNPVPVLVSPGVPLAGAQALGLGAGSSCALIAGGEVRCWGNNEESSLGDGTQISRSFAAPVLVGPGQPLTGAQALASGYWHRCVVMGDQGARCWGRNLDNVLGDGTNEDRPYAVLALLTSN